MRLAILLSLVLGCAGTANAHVCFDAQSREAGECPKRFYTPTQRDGDAILMDEKGKTLFSARVVQGMKKKDPQRSGIISADGREIVAPRFDRVYAVSRTLAVGELALDPKSRIFSQRAFLIDLTNGEIRATPWRSITFTYGGDADGAPYLLGIDPGTWQPPFSVAILDAAGGDTGLRVDKINPYVFRADVRTLPYGLIGLKDAIINARGEDVFAGMKMQTPGNGVGYFVEAGPKPAMVQGPASMPLLIPLASDAKPQDLPPGVVGMVKGSVWYWTIRQTPKGARFYQHDWGRPVLAAEPAGEAYLGLWINDRVAIVRTAAGWMDPYNRKPYPTPEAAAKAREAELDAFVKAVMAEEASRPQREAQQRAEAAAVAEANRQAALSAVRRRIQDAKAGRITGYPLLDLQREVMAWQLEGEYEAAGLWLSPDIKRQICWQRQSIICDRPAPGGSSSSGFVSTWEKAFENSRALSQSQYQENCAAAAKGASRICRTY